MARTIAGFPFASFVLTLALGASASAQYFQPNEKDAQKGNGQIAIHLLLDNTYSEKEGVVSKTPTEVFGPFDQSADPGPPFSTGRWNALTRALIGPIKCTAEKNGGGNYLPGVGRIDTTLGSLSNPQDVHYRSFYVNLLSDDTEKTEFEIADVPKTYADDFLNDPAIKSALFIPFFFPNQKWFSFPWGDPAVNSYFGLDWPYGLIDTAANPLCFPAYPADDPRAPLSQKCLNHGPYLFNPAEGVSITCEAATKDQGLLQQFWTQGVQWSYWSMENKPQAADHSALERVPLGSNVDLYTNPLNPISKATNIETVIDAIPAAPYRSGKLESIWTFGTPTAPSLEDLKLAIAAWQNANPAASACTKHSVLLITDGLANRNREDGVPGEDCVPYFVPGGTAPPYCQEFPDLEAFKLHHETDPQADLYVVNTNQEQKDIFSAPIALSDPLSPWLPAPDGKPDGKQLNDRTALLGNSKESYEVLDPQSFVTVLQGVFSEILANFILASPPIVQNSIVTNASSVIATTKYDPTSSGLSQGNLIFYALDPLTKNLIDLGTANPDAESQMRLEDGGFIPTLEDKFLTGDFDSDGSLDSFRSSNPNLTPALFHLANVSDALDNMKIDGVADNVIDDQDVNYLIDFVIGKGVASGTGKKGVNDQARTNILAGFFYKLDLPPLFFLEHFNKAGYVDFVSQHFLPYDPVLLAQSDDGILHCFGVGSPLDPLGPETLERKFSFLPEALLPRLRELRQALPPHLSTTNIDVRDLLDPQGNWIRIAVVNTVGTKKNAGDAGITLLTLAGEGAGPCLNPKLFRTYSHPEIEAPVSPLAFITTPDAKKTWAVMANFEDDRLAVFDGNGTFRVMLRPTKDSADPLIAADSHWAGYARLQAYDTSGDGVTDYLLATNYAGLTYLVRINNSDPENLVFAPQIFFDPLNPNAADVNGPLDIGTRSCPPKPACTLDDLSPTDNTAPHLFKFSSAEDVAVIFSGDKRAETKNDTKAALHLVKVDLMNPFGRGEEKIIHPPPAIAVFPMFFTGEKPLDVVVLQGILFILIKRAPEAPCTPGKTFLKAFLVASGIPAAVFHDSGSGSHSDTVEITPTDNYEITFDPLSNTIFYSYKDSAGLPALGQVQLPAVTPSGIQTLKDF